MEVDDHLPYSMDGGYLPTSPGNHLDCQYLFYEAGGMGRHLWMSRNPSAVDIRGEIPMNYKVQLIAAIIGGLMGVIAFEFDRYPFGPTFFFGHFIMWSSYCLGTLAADVDHADQNS